MSEINSRLSTALADRYTIERELGAGGMATVYLAEDFKHQRKVAVKIETTANLQHPHILPLFDSGRTVGRLDRRVSLLCEEESLMGRRQRDG